MNTELLQLYPQALWGNFATICDIPHPSGHEARITRHLEQFGKNLALETMVDAVGNVIIRKPATSGFEHCKGVILQGHLDMVPQKDFNVVHDFEKDPIAAYIDGEWVKARGTTLGADNGIGVAAIMAILQATDIPHGPIEALFTVDEEVGISGAFGLKPGLLRGKVLLNLDFCEEGVLCFGNAGAHRINASINYSLVPSDANVKCYKVRLCGLKGGHSGIEINKKPGNANKILGRMLYDASQLFGLRLATINGGTAHNAIPREAEAVVGVPENKSHDFEQFVNNYSSSVVDGLPLRDSNLTISFTNIEKLDCLIDERSQECVLSIICACPDGVLGMSLDIPELVETSNNLGIVKTLDGSIEISTMVRSMVNYWQDEITNTIKCLFRLAAAKITEIPSYLPWKPDVNSPVLQLMEKIYLQKFHQEPKAIAVHAGLECGVFKRYFPDLDMTSFGPTILDEHSPSERVSIPSVGKFWDLLVEVLKNIP